MRLRPVLVALWALLSLSAIVSCDDDSGSSKDDTGPISARQLSGVNLCKLLPAATMADLLGVDRLESDPSAQKTDDCGWTAPVSGTGDGKLQVGSFYLMDYGDRTTIGGLPARRSIQQFGCEILVGTTAAAESATEVEDALRVWYLGPGNSSDAENCRAARRLAEAVMRALPPDTGALR
jgi:hypothetical protein